jgi:glutaredoxin
MKDALLFIVFIACAYYVYNYDYQASKFYKNSQENNTKAANIGRTAQEIDASCDVILFSTASCPYCKKARGFLKVNEIAYCEKDINKKTANRKAYKYVGGKGVPVLVIGNKVIHGYKASAISNAVTQI